MTGYIFDLDGTILDSMPDWQLQLDNLLLSKGIMPPADLLDRTKTLGLENATGMILQEFHLPDDPVLVYQQFQTDMSKRYCSTIPLKPGIEAYLQTLYAKHSPMAVATATERNMVRLVLEHHGFTDYFPHITTVAEVGIGKHSPLIYQVTAKKLGIAPKDCIVFEDSLKGVLSAKQAGFKTVAIYEETNLSEQSALQREATWYIHDFRELL